MKPRIAPIVAIAIVVLLGLLVTEAAAAPTPIPQKFCKAVNVKGEAWGVDGSGARCKFMRFWTVKWLNRRDEPKGWSCVDGGETGGCDKLRGSAFFEYYTMD